MTERLFRGLPPFPENVLTADIPILSLSLLEADDHLESEKLFLASHTQGCFQLDLQGTSLGKTLLQEVEKLHKIGEDAFDLSLEEKMDYKMPPGKVTGYKSLGLSCVDEKGSRDRAEAWSIPKDNILDATVPMPYPETIRQNQVLLKNFCALGHDVASIIFRHLDAQLHLPPGTLISLHPFDGPSNCSGTVVRWVKCIPQPAHDQGISFVAHHDFGTITILFNILGGLQILPLGENCEWSYICPRPRHAVINIGDALARFTGGLLKPILHRVNCAPGAQASLTRYSISYFIRPEDNVIYKSLMGSDIIQQVAEREVEEEMTVREWNARRGDRLKIGDNAH